MISYGLLGLLVLLVIIGTIIYFYKLNESFSNVPTGYNSMIVSDSNGNLTNFSLSDLETDIDSKISALKDEVKQDYQPKGNYQSAGNYALSSDLAAYQPKGNYQLAGNYALSSDLAAYQPKGNYQLAGNYALLSDLDDYVKYDSSQSVKLQSDGSGSLKINIQN